MRALGTPSERRRKAANRDTAAAVPGLVLAGALGLLAVVAYISSGQSVAGRGPLAWGAIVLAFVLLVCHLMVVLRPRGQGRDGLTGLADRALFSRQVDKACAGAGQSAVILMDLDRFKEVNDALGHHHGDVLLCRVADRLQRSLRRGDLAARLGGDEFAVLLPAVSGLPEARAVAERALDALRQPFIIDDIMLDVGASAGIALSPDHGLGAASLLRRAEAAMYRAKSARSGTSVYQPDNDSHNPRQLALKGALRQAIEDGQLRVYFQPKVRLSDGCATGAEALVRWSHPELGLLAPDDFIPAAEQTGLIGPLTTFVLRQALRQCAEWRLAGHEIGVAVNLSVSSLLDVSLPVEVRRLLAESGTPPRLLTLEITESSVMADPPRTIAVLERLAKLGVRLSVDDFGTGYSSLAYLQRLPVQEVKVDKSFVLRMSSDTGDATIVQSIIELGHNLGLSVVAEGVEDQESWERLRAGSCDMAQGFHLSRPAPAGDISQWLDARAPRPRPTGSVVLLGQTRCGVSTPNPALTDA